MTLLILGLVLFIIGHLGTTVFATQRATLAARTDDNLCKLMALGVLMGSIYLMVQGWRAAGTTQLWTAPEWVRPIAVTLMLPTLILYFGGAPGSAIKSRIRHPQFTAVKLWALLHLVVNGDTRSLVLFGGMLAWVVLMLVLINKRDGKPPLPAPSPSAVKALAAFPIGLVAWMILLFAHRWLFGVSPLA